MKIRELSDGDIAYLESVVKPGLSTLSKSIEISDDVVDKTFFKKQYDVSLQAYADYFGIGTDELINLVNQYDIDERTLVKNVWDVRKFQVEADKINPETIVVPLGFFIEAKKDLDVKTLISKHSYKAIDLGVSMVIPVLALEKIKTITVGTTNKLKENEKGFGLKTFKNNKEEKIMKYDVKCTPIEASEIKGGKVIGLASIVIDDKFAVNSIRLIQKDGDENGRLMYPNRKSSKTESGYQDIAFPITSELYGKLYDGIIESYNAGGEIVSVEAKDNDYTISASVYTKDNLQGFAQINFGEFVVNDITIRKGGKDENGKDKPDFVAMPSYQKKDGEYQSICNPITKEAYDEFNKAIMDAYAEAVKEKEKSKTGTFEHKAVKNPPKTEKTEKPSGIR